MPAPTAEGDLDTLGALIRAGRDGKDLTQDKLSKLVNIAQAEISAIESGARQKVPVDHLLTIAGALDLDGNEVIAAAAARAAGARRPARHAGPPEAA